MNKKQTVVMWLGVIWVVLIWISAPRDWTEYSTGIILRGKYVSDMEQKVAHVLFKPADVFVNWTAGGIIASALIYALRTKEKQDGKKSEQGSKELKS